MTGEIFDLKRYAVHDGPGIRCTAFLKGCPLSCIWCHNPEGMRTGPELCLQPGACIGCGACVEACPVDAVAFGETGVAIDRQRCTRCGECAACCPSKALTRKGRPIAPEALVEELARDEVFFQTSGGGITLSGGDPLFQPDFAHTVLGLAKERGYHTAVETSLYAPATIVDRLQEVVDLWLCDLKLFDGAQHRRLTGRGNQRILDNYARLASRGCAMLTRIPVIPSCTDSRENLAAIGEYVAATNPAGTVELMFYNPLAAAKYHSYGLPYPLGAGAAQEDRQKAVFRDLLTQTGVAAVI